MNGTYQELLSKLNDQYNSKNLESFSRSETNKVIITEKDFNVYNS